MDSSSKLRTELDMLSDLPLGVKEKILTYLPIKEAGRTSILSTKWRYAWSSIPELKFSELDTSSVEFEKLVDQVFLLHNGTILKFHLVTPQNSSKEAVDRWILNLSRNGITKLRLHLRFHEAHYYKINSNLFSCDSLRSIKLENCTLRVPKSFKGFKHLTCLELVRVSISADDVKTMISSCPLLKKLFVIDLENVIALDIHAPNLLLLGIRGWFSDIQIYAPKLFLLSIVKYPAELVQHIRGNLARVLGNMPNLVYLQLKRHVLKYICVCGPSLDELPFLTFNQLKNIYIDLNFNEEKEAAFIFALFQRAPHLLSLDITVQLTEERPSL